MYHLKGQTNNPLLRYIHEIRSCSPLCNGLSELNHDTTLSVAPIHVQFCLQFELTGRTETVLPVPAPQHTQTDRTVRLSSSVRPVIWLSVDVCSFFVGKMSSVDELLAFAAINCLYFLKQFRIPFLLQIAFVILFTLYFPQ
jgi:hypothetical protein